MSRLGHSKYLNVLAILGCEFCERLAYYGIGSSLTLFLRSYLGYSTEAASVTYTLWSSFATLFAVAAGYLSDVHWGKKKTILIGAVIYAISLTAVSIITFVFDFGNVTNVGLTVSEVLFWIALYAMMVGAGGIKSCVGLFGAAQLHSIAHPLVHEVTESDNVVSYDPSLSDAAQQQSDAESEARQLIESYWNWFYFAINAGALISYTGISYLCQVQIGPNPPISAYLLAIVNVNVNVNATGCIVCSWLVHSHSGYLCGDCHVHLARRQIPRTRGRPIHSAAVWGHHMVRNEQPIDEGTRHRRGRRTIWLICSHWSVE